MSRYKYLWLSTYYIYIFLPMPANLDWMKCCWSHTLGGPNRWGSWGWWSLPGLAKAFLTGVWSKKNSATAQAARNPTMVNKLTNYSFPSLSLDPQSLPRRLHQDAHVASASNPSTTLKQCQGSVWGVGGVRMCACEPAFFCAMVQWQTTELLNPWTPDSLKSEVRSQACTPSQSCSAFLQTWAGGFSLCLKSSCQVATKKLPYYIIKSENKKFTVNFPIMPSHCQQSEQLPLHHVQPLRLRCSTSTSCPKPKMGIKVQKPNLMLFSKY